MSNTNHHLPDDRDKRMGNMENVENGEGMPPIPQAGAAGLQVCNVVQLYLAVLDDLPPEQVNTLMHHVRTCADCTAQYQLSSRATHAMSGFRMSTPSARVDQAIMMVIASRAAQSVSTLDRQLVQTEVLPQPVRIRKRRQPSFWLVSQIAAAVILLLGLLTVAHYVMGSPTEKKGFALPQDLTWDAYVIYHSETRIAPDGAHYIVNTYDDLGNGDFHVETMMDSSLDVVAIGDSSVILGLDMMHHVAQWGANAWSVDQSEESMFNLPQLRSDLTSNLDTYLGTDVFHGQDVYRVRYQNGLVLLLDAHYMPVNILRGAVGPGTGDPLYTTVTLMPVAQVSNSMWSMSVPAGFQMGTLPAQP